METFYYAMTSNGPRMLSAASVEAAIREIYSDYYLRKAAKYIYSVKKWVDRPEGGWNADEFQMDLPL